MENNKNLFDGVDGYTPKNSNDDNDLFDDNFYNDEFDSDEPITNEIDKIDLGYYVDYNSNRKIDINMIAYLKNERMYNAKYVIDEINKLINIIEKHSNLKTVIKKDDGTEEKTDDLGIILSDMTYAWLNKEWIYSVTENKKDIHKIIHTTIKSFRITNETELKHHNKVPQKEDILKKLKSIIELLKKHYFDNILNYEVTTPYNYMIIKNKFANTYTKSKFYQDKNNNSLIDKDGNYFIDKDLVISGENEPLIKTRVILTYDRDNITYSKKLEPFDRAVYDAIISLYNAGNKHFTIPTVYRVLTGQNRGKGGEEMEKEIEKSINKLWGTMLEIDFTEEAKRRNFDVDKTIKKRHLLDLEYVFLKSRGNTFKGYSFLAEPILFEYAKLTGQILPIEMDLLSIDVYNTKEIVIIKHYFFREIDYIKHGRSSNNIYFDKINTELGLKDIIKQKAEKIRKHSFEILDRLIEKKHIKDYNKICVKNKKTEYIKRDEKTPAGAKIKGINIILNETLNETQT